MRGTFVKASKGLLTFTTLGIVSILLGFLYFTGVASSNRLLLGFDYKILITFGIYLTLITALPVLSGMDARAKTSVKKISPHLILMACVGILGLIYSFLVYGVYLTPIDVQHTWADYFIVSATIFVIGFVPLLFAVKDRDRLWNFKFVYFALIIIGAVLEILAVLVYGQYLDAIISIPDISWDTFFLSGGIFVLLGILPLLVGASTNLRDLIHKTRILWIIGVAISFALILLSLTIRVEILEPTAILNTEWFVWFWFGSLLLIVTTGILVSSRDFSGFLNKLRGIWIITFLIGIIMSIISLLLAASSSPEIVEIISLPDNLAGYTWDFYFMYGAILSLFSLIIIISIIYFETEEVSGDVSSGLAADSFRDLKTTPSEMVTYLEILSKSEASLINQFKEAVREDKFRPRVYETLLKQYENRIRSYKSKISSIRKEPSKTRAADKVGAIFDTALGDVTPPKVTAKSPPPLPPVAPKSSVSDVPSPPPSVPLPPRSVPQATPPPMPSPSIAPPSPVSADSVLTPTASSDSPLDLVADARSTSIAELRGEMLKELRRLREIFKEE
ncbi:MAG: hypothetical protein ACXAC6_15535 [Candidatus Hodarchaeales archaeon]